MAVVHVAELSKIFRVPEREAVDHVLELFEGIRTIQNAPVVISNQKQ